MRRSPQGIYPGDLFWAKRNILYRATGEFRAPLKGESRTE